VQAERRRTETAAGSDQPCRSREYVSFSFQKSVKDGGYGKTDDFEAKVSVDLNGHAKPIMATWNQPSTDKGGGGMEPGEERNKLEMVANRPTPIPRRNWKKRRAILSATVGAKSGTAAF
jgi:hypothetical protein